MKKNQVLPTDVDHRDDYDEPVLPTDVDYWDDYDEDDDDDDSSNEHLGSHKRTEIRCPKCSETALSVNQRGFGLGKAILGGAAGALLFGPVGLAGLMAGLAGSKKIKITCLKCGHVFSPNR